MEKKKIKNLAFIDGQNLYMGTGFSVDFKKMRVYLRDKYYIEKAYYFVGFRWQENNLYENLQDAWFILVFNEKAEWLKSNKKGNIDVTLVFYAMRKYIENEFDKMLLISGDGDYKIMVDYFIEQHRFLRILAPNMKYCSSLYKKWSNFPHEYISSIADIRNVIEYTKLP